MRMAGPLRPGTRVLDVGCGNGYWAGEFARRGCQVVGVDPSTSGIALARANYSQVRFECLDATADLRERMAEKPFDLVISIEVVEHLYDPLSYASGCLAALRPGGRVVMSTPFHGRIKNAVLAVSGKLDAHHEALRVGGHIKFFSRTSLERLLVDAGFCNPRFEGAGRVPQLWKSMVLAADKPA
jgi:2-polyprenyl-6-hydroxyphenyl methylase/3-demethylubiquinone-9 3-methyltransferase